MIISAVAILMLNGLFAMPVDPKEIPIDDLNGRPFLHPNPPSAPPVAPFPGRQRKYRPAESLPEIPAELFESEGLRHQNYQIWNRAHHSMFQLLLNYLLHDNLVRSIEAELFLHLQISTRAQLLEQMPLKWFPTRLQNPDLKRLFCTPFIHMCDASPDTRSSSFLIT